MKQIWALVFIFSLLVACQPSSPADDVAPVKSKFYKTDLQFISIAYTDIEGKAIPPEELARLRELFLSQGDQTFNRLQLISYLLQNHKGELSGEKLRVKYPDQFIDFCFKKFYSRYHGEKERKELLNRMKHSELTTEKWYFAFMSSKEYALL